MIKIYPYAQLGHKDYGWLNARYHFSFGEYYNPERLSFGKLRVINDDIVKAGKGFHTHPHKDMEIITYVRRGAITHKDSEGNEGRTEAGNIQVMSAGTGIYHSEFNYEDEDTTLYQIWIEPRETGIQPRWDMKRFPRDAANDSLPLLVSGRTEDKDKDVLFIHQDAALYGGRLSSGSAIEHSFQDRGYLLVSEGEIEIEGQTMRQGDGAEITDMKTTTIKALSDAELVLIEAP